jgi:hypothetical protein
VYGGKSVCVISCCDGRVAEALSQDDMIVVPCSAHVCAIRTAEDAFSRLFQSSNSLDLKRS